jgi:hypothetical protein
VSQIDPDLGTCIVMQLEWHGVKINKINLLNTFRWNDFPGVFENSTVRESAIANPK